MTEVYIDWTMFEEMLVDDLGFETAFWMLKKEGTCILLNTFSNLELIAIKRC